MDIRICKTDFSELLSLTEKAIYIIKCKSPTNREYNVARRLGNVRKKLIRINNLEK